MVISKSTGPFCKVGSRICPPTASWGRPAVPPNSGGQPGRCVGAVPTVPGPGGQPVPGRAECRPGSPSPPRASLLRQVYGLPWEAKQVSTRGGPRRPAGWLFERVPTLLAVKAPHFHCDRLPARFHLLHLCPSHLYLSRVPRGPGITSKSAIEGVAAPLLAPSAMPPYLCRAPIAGRLGLGSPGAGARHTASAGPT